MNLNIAAPVLDLDDEPVVDDGPDKTPITYRRLILDVLNARPDDAMRCFDILLKMRGKDDVDLDEGERTFIKQRATGILFPLYWGRLNEFLSDPKAD